MSRSVDHPIDFVITWVDGNDPAWLNEQKKYQAENLEMNGPERFRDWENLQYLFRAFEYFTPWVNKVHFVTWGHVPDWLNKTHPKLNIVRHEDFLDPNDLPVFNINAIEINLHRIIGLSERFVFFNDDTFLLKALTPSVFFKHGLPVNAMISNIMHQGAIAPIVLNDIELINKHFNRHKGQRLTKRGIARKHFWKWFYPGYGFRLLDTLFLMYWKTFSGFVTYHQPQPFLKRIFQDVWNNEEELLRRVSASKFRSNTDVNQYLFRYWQFVTGNFTPDTFTNAFKRRKYVELRSVDDVVQACADIIDGDYQMYCLNDSMSKGRFTDRSLSDIEIDKCKKLLIHALDKKLPRKSSFECD
ncbi:Stealth CR1 domain-containing protein [Alteromonas oceanisediminis]|uniref:Stealth CR1 domain-containing protein n=1 Tax=Alteromonas oceanisediminis TaxID=2836180 RepID=UPI001BDB3414|nr:Stealth CR1 domain-containing protein [Alteromonas oceanisediminis]MBT0584928.1 Stealth CR1 domain-containing protein [Alteromonas oceanisediminis]